MKKDSRGSIVFLREHTNETEPTSERKIKVHRGLLIQAGRHFEFCLIRV